VAVCGGTFLSTAAIMTKQFSTEHAPRFTSVVLLLAIGIVNGCAVYMQSLKATDPTVSAGVLMMTICIMMVVWAAILDFALNGASLSGRQGAGLALAILAIYLLKK
jgi:drug/metabolite transporter (DMT)-like permease